MKQFFVKQFFVKLVEILKSENAFFVYAYVGAILTLPKTHSVPESFGQVLLALVAGFSAERLVRIERKLDDVAYDVDLGLFEPTEEP